MGEWQHEAGREGRGTGGSVRWGTCRKRGHVGRGGAMQSQRISNPRDENKGGGNVNQWALRGRWKGGIAGQCGGRCMQRGLEGWRVEVWGVGKAALFVSSFGSMHYVLILGFCVLIPSLIVPQMGGGDLRQSCTRFYSYSWNSPMSLAYWV
ncbi:hypothetical protein SDJN03_13774, partial [Cucurbita argyrosperma subsp. sororia]